jgi:hypothetical protein
MVLLAASFSLAPTEPGRTQSVQHLSITLPGGMPGMPVMTGITAGTNGLTLTWDGPAGYYQLFQMPMGATNAWQALGKPTNLVRRTTIPLGYSNVMFHVAGPGPNYAGDQVCGTCHPKIHSTELLTAHAQAFETLKQAGQATNASCLPCHTVGYGLPTGFISETATPKLAGVQCENCHGPAANHAASEYDPVYRPRVEIAAQVCGGCHSWTNRPAYNEWATSDHVNVAQDMNPTNRIDSCGRCHSGNARLSLIKHEQLPYGDANIGIVCAVCHDPHQTNANPAQVRNPLSSTNDYFITTSGAFTNQYQTNINICAQCHNHRGADWTATDRPPHHSAQYNSLIGTIGLVTNNPPLQPHPHALRIANQCVDCHMQQTTNQGAITGHSFQVTTYNLCVPCHGNQGQSLAQFTTNTILFWVDQVHTELNLWAATKAPPNLWTNYGTRAWEYTNPGDLSPNGSGPNSTEQALIPVGIQQARFNLYLVYNEGSFGVHNARLWALPLLFSAMDWVENELSQ